MAAGLQIAKLSCHVYLAKVAMNAHSSRLQEDHTNKNMQGSMIGLPFLSEELHEAMEAHLHYPLGLFGLAGRQAAQWWLMGCLA